MPRYVFAGPAGRRYPEHRDAQGAVVGEPAVGEERDFDRPWEWEGADPPEYWPAPDECWFPAGQELPLREAPDPAPPQAPAAKSAPDGGTGDSGAPDGGPPAQQAPPAAPGPKAVRRALADSGTAADSAAGNDKEPQAS